MKRTLLSLFAFMLAVPTFAQQHEGAKFRKIDSLLTYLYANNKFMGSIAIAKKARSYLKRLMAMPMQILKPLQILRRSIR